MFKRFVYFLTLLPLAGGLARADFSYVETTKVTGGSLLRMMRFVPGGTKSLTDPTQNSVYLKGNRMATFNNKSGQIIDLDKETITHIDFEKKTYSVMTFAEMAQMMAEMQKAAQQRMAEAKAKQPEAESNAKMDMKVDIKETGISKSINGLDAKQFVMTVEMLVSAESQAQQAPSPVGMATKIVSDMWMASTLPGYEEVQAFQKKVAMKLVTSSMPAMNPMMFQQRGSSEMYKRMAEEGSKLQGTPILTVTRMMGPGGPGGPGAQGPDMSQVGDAAKQEAANDAQAEAARQAAMASGGRMGGLAGAAAGGMLGGLGRKKPQQQPKEQAPPPSQAQSGSTTDNIMLETTAEKSGFAQGSVPAEKLEIPAGFQQVEPEMKKNLEQMKRGR